MYRLVVPRTGSACLKNNSVESTSGSTSSTSDSSRSTGDSTESTSDSTRSTSDSVRSTNERFGQVKERLDRLETGQGKMSDRIEALDQHMHVLHEDVIARIAATRDVRARRAEFAELKEMLGRRLDRLEATVRLHSREIDKLKRGRRELTAHRTPRASSRPQGCSRGCHAVDERPRSLGAERGPDPMRSYGALRTNMYSR